MADEGSTTRQAGDDDDSGVHRLRDIVVEEVSLVDRAANKRRFLLVKRSNQMADDGKSKGADTSQEGRTSATPSRGGKKPRRKPDEDADKTQTRVMRAASGNDEDDEDDEDTEKARRPRPTQDDGDGAADARKVSSSDDENDNEDDESEEDEETEDDEDQETEEDDENDDAQAAGVGKAGENGDKDKPAKADAEADDGDEARETNRRQRRASVEGDGARPARGGKPVRKAENDAPMLSSEVKNTVLRALAQVLERLMAVANQVKDADEPDDDEDASTPDDLVDELEDIGEVIEDIGEQLAGVAEKSGAKKPGAANGRAARSDDAKAGARKTPRAKGSAAKADVRDADVAKAGRRMAKERLDRFRKALELLSSVLQELTEDERPQGPSAGSAEKSVAKRDAAPGMGELVASVQELTRIVQRQEEQLVRLQKTRATSNAIPIEGRSRHREIQEVSWPLDMNRPISRDRVDKAISFYDDQD